MQILGPRHCSTRGEDNQSVLKCLNIIGLSYFWGTLTLVSYVTVFIYIPTNYEHYPHELYPKTYASYFLIAEIIINYFMVILKKSHYDHKKSQAIPNSRWSNCLDCQSPKPPRTHHCPSCRKCIIKRDHHCFLTGTCIGFHNQRYMLVLATYCLAGSIYAYIMCFNYCTLMYGYPLSKQHWYHYILPVSFFECIFGDKSYGFALHVSMLYLIAMTILGALSMTAMQSMFGLFGMTQKDYTSGMVPDFKNVKVLDNLHETFGYCYILNFIIPMPCLKQKGDGISSSNNEELDKMI